MNKIITNVKYKSYLSLACLLLCTLLSACSYDDLSVTKPNENFRLADDFLKNNYDFSLFYAALQYTGLADTLHKAGPYTVIAPNNKAFNEIGIQLPGDIYKLNRDSLRQAMAYHIINRKLLVANMPVNGVDVRYQTLAGIQLYLSMASFDPLFPEYVNHRPFFSGSLAYRKDIPLVNGTMHAVDKIMKQYPGVGVQKWLAARPQYSIFVSGLKKFGLWDELAQKGPFTIFAPENKAFTDAGITQAVVDGMNPAQYIGPRLFGCYIFYNKSYFTTDREVFATINRELEFYTTPRNDNSKISWYNSLDMSMESVQGGSNSWYYRIAASRPKSDNLCTDGMVHTLSGVLVKPANALKN